MFYNCTGNLNGFKTGDLITGRVKSLPFIFHKGLVVKEHDGLYVWHNTPMYSNEFGGSVVKETLSEWLKSREISKTENTNLDTKNIESTSLKMKDKTFDVLTFNCEQYVYLIKDKIPKSPQLMFWAFTGISALVLFVAFKNSKEK